MQIAWRFDMAKRLVAGATLVLASLLGARTALADGVRPDACWAEGEPCGTAGGQSLSGICTPATCTHYGPIDCAGAGGQGGEAGIGGAAADKVCLGYTTYDCLRCLPGTGGTHAGGSGGTLGGGRGGTGGTVAGSGTVAEGGAEAGEGGHANGGNAGTSGGGTGPAGGDSGCGCRVGRATDEQSLAGLMLLVGFAALGRSRRLSPRNKR